MMLPLIYSANDGRMKYAEADAIQRYVGIPIDIDGILYIEILLVTIPNITLVNEVNTNDKLRERKKHI